MPQLWPVAVVNQSRVNAISGRITELKSYFNFRVQFVHPRVRVLVLVLCPSLESTLVDSNMHSWGDIMPAKKTRLCEGNMGKLPRNSGICLWYWQCPGIHKTHACLARKLNILVAVVVQSERGRAEANYNVAITQGVVMLDC